MPPPSTYLFGPFRLETAERRLVRQGQAVRLAPRVFDVLSLLVSRAGSLVTREDLLATVWSGAFVEEANVTHTIWQLRRALDEGDGPDRYIETVPKVGYRFVAPVSVEGPGASAPSPVQPDVTPPAAAVEVPAAPPRGRGQAIAITTLVLVAAALGGFWLWPGGTDPAGAVTLAVLPFASIGQDEDRLYLSNGLTEETISALGQVAPERLRVVGRASAARYRGSGRSFAEIGRELAVDYLVEGSVQWEGERVRVTSKLVRVGDQVQVWSDSFDRRPTSALELQGEVSVAIAEAVRERLGIEAAPAVAHLQTLDPAAYDLYLRGNYSWRRLSSPTNKVALEYFQRATALDPDYALAWAGIAHTLAASPINSDVAPLEVLPRAREAAERAVRAEPALATAHAALGIVHYWAWNASAAEASLRRAIALDPGDAMPERVLGQLLSQTGRQREATEHLQRARRLDPFSAINHALSSQVAFQGRDTAAALGHARRALALDPEFWIGSMMLGQVNEQLGRGDEAVQALVDAARLSNGNGKPVALQAYVLGKMGRSAEARALLTVLEDAAHERFVPPYHLALAHAGLGDREAVFEWLERGYAARDVHFVFLPVDPKWDSYRDDPRFAALLKRCGLSRSRRSRPRCSRSSRRARSIATPSQRSCFLHDAARAEKATAEMIRGLAAHLRSMKRDPERRRG